MTKRRLSDNMSQMESEKKNYEISFLLKEENDVEAVLKHLSQIGAEILNEGRISETKLAYPIKKLNSAYFGWLHFAAQPDEAVKLNAALKLEGRVLRYLIITPPITKTEKKKSPRPAERSGEQSASPAAESAASELSNEELEKKLEEILK